tara:strand:+ start:270 stop:3395 length:3126 start_codon:yes stop_codon:yes gene_type:complete
MGEVSVNTPQGVVNFKISGETPTVQEKVKIRRILERDFRFGKRPNLLESRRETPLTTTTEQEEVGPQFDTETGIRDRRLRARLSRAEDKNEEEAVLGSFGLGTEDYLRDNRGRLALTPSGAAKFGVKSDKNVLIDERGLTRGDLFDLAGLAPEVGGAVAGGIKGASLGSALGPIGTVLGGAIGSAVGAFGGSLAEEGLEVATGVSRQTGKEIVKDAGREALYAGAGELLFGAPFLIFKALQPGSKLAKEGGEKLATVGKATERGYVVSQKTLGTSPLAQKIEELLTAVIGTSPARSASRKQLDKDIKRYTQRKEQLQGQTKKEFGELISKTPSDATQQIINQSKVIQKKLSADLDSVIKDLDTSIRTGKKLDKDLFDQITNSMVLTKKGAIDYFKDVDNVVKASIGKDTAGDIKFISTAPIKEISDDINDLYTGPGGLVKRTEPEKAFTYLKDEFAKLGDKTNFTTLYNLRKTISDLSLGLKPQYMDEAIFSSIEKAKKTVVKEQPGMFDTYLNAYKNAVDDLLKFNEKDLVNIKSLSKIDRDNLIKASDKLKPARGQYFKDIDKFDKIATQIQSRRFIEQFKNVRDQKIAKELDPDVKVTIPTAEQLNIKEGFALKLLKPDDPSVLKSLKESLDAVDSKLYDKFKNKIGNQFLNNKLRTSGYEIGNIAKFDASSYRKSLEELKSTGVEIFGKEKYDSLLKQAKNMDDLGPSNISQNVVDDIIRSDDVVKEIGLDNLNKISDAIKNDKILKTNKVLQSIRSKQDISGQITTQDAMDVITSNTIPINQFKEVVDYFKTQNPEQFKILQRTYIESMFEGVGTTFDAKILNRFSNNIKKLDGYDNLGRPNKKLDILFDKEEAADIREFGDILKLLADDVGTGSLVAAGLTANFLAQIPKIARITILGNVVSSKRAREQVIDAYNKSKGLPPEKRGSIVGDAFLATVRQFAAQSIDEGAREADKQIGSAIESQGLGEQLENIRGNLNLPSPSSALSDLNITAPNITTPSTPTATVSPQSNLRQRIKDDPAAANVLLGGLGSAGLA